MWRTAGLCGRNRMANRPALAPASTAGPVCNGSPAPVETISAIVRTTCQIAPQSVPARTAPNMPCIQNFISRHPLVRSE